MEIIEDADMIFLRVDYSATSQLKSMMRSSRTNLDSVCNVVSTAKSTSGVVPSESSRGLSHNLMSMMNPTCNSDFRAIPQ